MKSYYNFLENGPNIYIQNNFKNKYEVIIKKNNAQKQ